MITWLTAAALAADPTVPVAWEDPLSAGTPRHLGVGLSEGLVLGSTTYAFTRLNLAAPLLSRPTVGFGFSAWSEAPALYVPDEARGGFGLGGQELAMHLWFSPREHPGTVHDLVLFSGLRGGTDDYFVRYSDVFYRLGFGYSGYYDAAEAVDVSFDAQLGVGAGPSIFAIFVATGNVSTFWATPREDLAILVGADVSITTVALVAGARWRPVPAAELGAGVAVPVLALEPGGGELPLWPVLDAKVRF